MDLLDSLPGEPLSRSVVDSLDEAAAIQATFPIYGQLPSKQDTALGLVLVVDETAHALAYDDDHDAWVSLDKTAVETRGDGIAFSDANTIDELQEQIADYLGVETPEHRTFGSDLKIDDEKPENDENKRPPEVEQGLEPEYDCPDCDYYATGLSTGPHTFLDHLQNEHGYSRDEAFDILNG